MSNIFRMIKECVQYKDLISELVSRDIKVRYRRSVLGLLWTMLTPILMMAVMTIVFSKLFRFEIENYVVYLLIGNVMFSFFSDATSNSLWSIVTSSALIKKVYIPKSLFPISKTLSCAVNLCFSLVALFVVMIVTKTTFYPSILLLPVSMIYLLIFAMGVGMILSTYTVFFRDISHLYSVMILAWMYATPIFYPASLLEENAPILLKINPMYYYINYARQLILSGQIPGLKENIICLTIGIVTFAIGFFALSRKQNKFILYI